MNHPLIKRGLCAVQIITLIICTLLSNVPACLATTTATSPPDQTAVGTQATIPTTTTTQHVLTEEEKRSVEALRSHRAALQEQAQNLQKTRQEYSNSIDGLLKQQDNIQEQILLKQREIDINTHLKDTIRIQLATTDDELIRQEQTILVRRQAILSRFEALRQKLRTLSKSGKITAIQMIASSDSYASFLINTKMAQRMSEHDQSIITGLENELANLESQRTLLKLRQEQLENDKISFENAGHDLDVSKNQLLDLLAQATDISDQLSSHLAYYSQQYLGIKQQQSSLQQQINSITHEFSPGSMLAASVMNWPAPDCTIITSSYKARWGRWHYGLDIASWGDSTGKDIVAAADGTVIFSSDTSDGYGNYVMIDHGHDADGHRIVTLYGHCSERFVQVGDVVFGGQTVIAAVGNTGNSTGPHLHFEVRVDGNAVDPVAEGFILTDGITIAG